MKPFTPCLRASVSISLSLFLSLCAFAAREVVQIADDGVTTVPANSIATPAQATNATVAAQEAYNTATGLAARAEMCVEKLAAYGTNYVVTSTVYVQSIGGVPYDPSNQTINVQSFTASSTNISIVATVKQTPLVPPSLDWRVSLSGGAWSNITATVATTDIPAGVTNAAAAYTFTLAKPGTASSFFRVVDNSTGASGSGLWWVVFGGITVDGHLGMTGPVTNGADVLNFVGGILVEPEPLGGM
jgi:hypothetical protein